MTQIHKARKATESCSCLPPASSPGGFCYIFIAPLLNHMSQEIPCHQGIRTLCFHYRGPGFNPGQELKSCKAQCGQNENKTPKTAATKTKAKA